MKKILSTIIFCTAVLALKAQQTPAQQLAGKFAQRMMDSLELTTTQRDQLIAVNLQLHDQKMQVRQQYAGTDSIRYYLQKTENTRDSLYNAVLPPDKYLLYRQRKTQLINNN